MCKYHDYRYIEMLEKDNIIQKYNHGEKSIKILFAVYADTDSLLEKIDAYHNNPEESQTAIVNKYIECGYLLFINCSSDSNRNKYDYYRGKDCLKNFCED